jgi:putative ABC transport system permease protein
MLLIVFLASTLFTGFVANADGLSKRINNYYSESNLADLRVLTTSLNNSDKFFFSDLPLDSYEYRLDINTTINEQNSRVYVGNNTISKPIVAKGVAGVMIDAKRAELNEFEIGDIITIKVPNFSWDIQMAITGFMYFPEIINTMSVMPVYIQEELFENALNSYSSGNYEVKNLYNEVVIKTKHPNEIRAEVEDYYLNFRPSPVQTLIFVFDATTTESEVLIKNEIDQSWKMITVFPTIFILVSMLVNLTTISRLVTKDRSEIGLMKAIGLNNFSITVYYCLFGFLISFIGSILGVFLGPMIVPNAMNVKYNLAYSLPKTSFYLINIPWSILIVFVVTLFAILLGFISVSAVLRESPSNCFRPKLSSNMLNLFNKGQKS